MSHAADLMPHCVHVWARGHYAGKYDFPTRAAAVADKRDRDAKFGVLGLCYDVLPGVLPATPPAAARDGEG